MFTGSEVRRVGQGNRTDSAAPMFDMAHAGGLTGGSRFSAGPALVQRSVDDEDDDGDGDDDGDDDAVGDDVYVTRCVLTLQLYHRHDLTSRLTLN